MTYQINLSVIYPNSVQIGGQFDLLEGKFWGCHRFLWLFYWFKKWHFRHFWHIFSTYWRILSEWVSKSFYEKFNFLLPFFALNLTYWRPNLRTLSFSLPFILVQKVTFQAVLAHSQQILEDFFWMTWVDKAFYETFTLLGRVFAVNLTH